jgi:molybdenum cofactor synthesis domain-containing protein
MCDTPLGNSAAGVKTIHLSEAVGSVLAHDITEIRQGEFKGPAFRKGHIIREEDICHLQRLGKEHFFVLDIAENEVHEDDAAYELTYSLIGQGVEIGDTPREGKINLVAGSYGLLKIDKDALLQFNMLGDVICATLHNNTVICRGDIVASVKTVPLLVKREIINRAADIANASRKSDTENKRTGVIEIKQMRSPSAGIVVTGNEIFSNRIKDVFAPVIQKKIEALGGRITNVCYAPDDESFIEARIRELMENGADLIITTGGMSVDPDDVTRFAIRRLGATDITYGSPVLPGAMFLIAYLGEIPILGIPACGMYHKATVFDLVLPRVLAGERLGRRELAELGHGGLCRKCDGCVYPHCPFGK